MAWLLISKRSRRRAVAWTLGGIAISVATLVPGSLAVAPGPAAWTAAGFISFVLCVSRGLKRLRADEMVFEGRRPLRSASGRTVTEPPATFRRIERTLMHTSQARAR